MRRGWSSQRRREEEHRPAPLPFLPGEVSNGEFLPREATGARPRHRRGGPGPRVGRGRPARARPAPLPPDRGRHGGDARRGQPRRCCGGGGSSEARRTTSTTTTTRPSTTAGTFEVPEPEETEACEHALGDQGELIFDVHTHHVMPDRPWKQNAPRILDMIRGLAPATCTEAEPDRVPEPGRLPARPVPGQRHDHRDAVRRAQLGPGRRPGAVRRRGRHRRLRAAAGRGRRTARARAQRDRAELRPAPGAARRHGGARRDRSGRGVQGVHRVGSGPAGLLDARSGHRDPRRRAGPLARRQGALRAQGPAAARVRPSLQRSGGHRRAGGPVSRT